ncbi:MAG: sodium:solute symporter family transporter, partial [Marinirhabdus sp.]
VAIVLQHLVFDTMGVPFWATVTLTILLIWLYTFKSGIKTIVWTDTLQTLFMLIALGAGIYYLATALGIAGSGLFTFIAESDLSQIFFFDDWKSGDHFFKQFLSGAFIAIVMTGLDQDMMQKNLTCRSLKDAQKNMFWFTVVLTVVNFIFLALGLLLTVYAQQQGIDAHRDQLFPTIAVQSGLGIGLAVFFLLGLIAAAYSSADSALASLTTSFSIDIMDIEKKYPKAQQVRLRKRVHIGMSVVLAVVIIIFNYVIGDASVIAKVFTFAGYTYGPLLGLYAFGLFTKTAVKDKWVPLVAIAAPFLGGLVSYLASTYFNFDFGFFVLVLNGLITYLGLVCVRRQKH